MVLRKDILLMVQTIFNLPKIIGEHGTLKKSYIENKEVRLLALLMVGSIPTAFVGFIFQSFYEFFLSSTIFVGFMLLLSGSFLWLTKSFANSKRKTILQTNIKDSTIIGLMQGIAVIPGISRSGITISTGLILGMDHELAGRFSFLLSVPAILGAFILNLCSSHDLQMIVIKPNLIIIGTIISTVIGYIVLKLILYITKTKRIHVFAPYCYLIGLVLLMTI
jgi:undecaprenyl-diphosphatase